MSIAVLNQVYDETRRLAIAGSNLAADDFRLKKLIPQLKKAGEKAPVFAKVGESAEKLINSPSKDSANALLDLSTLVTAILYTQGTTGAEGKLQPIETSDMRLPSSMASARVLKPLIEALTTTGSGRLEIIRDAHERGAFQDLRLIRPALAAIDDVYGEIGDFMAEKVLPIYGKGIYTEIRESFHLKGKGGDARRLKLLHQLDPEATGALVEEALESGSKDVKVAALACLKGNAAAIPLLIEQTAARAQEIRRTALQSLAEFKDARAVDALIKALGGADLSLVSSHVSRNPSPKVLAYLLEESNRLLEEMFSSKNKEQQGKAVSRFYELLSCFNGRSDKKSLAVLGDCYTRREQIGKLKGKSQDGGDVNRKVAALMVASGNAALRKRLAEDADALAPELFSHAFLAAITVEKPKAVYERFAPYLLYKPAKKKQNDPQAERQAAVYQALTDAAHQRVYHSSGVSRDYLEVGRYETVHSIFQEAKLDDRWLDAAVELGDYSLVAALARPKHQPTLDFLAKFFEANLKKKDWHWETLQSLITMARLGHPKTEEYLMQSLKKMAGGKGRYYGGWWLGQVMNEMPKSSVAKIEAMIPDFPEWLVDDLVPYLTEAKAKQ